MLRVRRDVAGRLDLPGARLLGEDEERAHYALEGPGTCEPVPLAAVVFLDEGNDAALEPVEQPEAIRDLWALSFRLPTEEDVGRSFAGAGENLAKVGGDEQASVAVAIEKLMASPTHRENIMSPDFRFVGVGSVTSQDGVTIFTTVFTDR